MAVAAVTGPRLPITPVLTNGLIMFLHTNQGEIPIQFYRAVEH